MKLRIATRKSQLALVQTRWVAAQIQLHDPSIEIEEVQILTRGDRIQDRPLREVGGKGLFVSEVQAALMRDDADLAVHSLKDVPGDVGLPEGMELICVPKREVPDDWLITPGGAALDDLHAGAKVGTTSLRRICQLRAARPDLVYLPLRGNVNTRLRKLDEGEYDAIVLAGAGLRRLGMDDRPHWRIPTSICIPAVGQGTLALEGRADHQALRDALAPLEDRHSRVQMEAERSFLRTLEGNCHVPVAGHARYRPDEALIGVEAFVGSDDTERTLHAGAERYLTDPLSASIVEIAKEMGREVANQLIARGARDLMRDALSNVERKKHGGEGWTWN